MSTIPDHLSNVAARVLAVMQGYRSPKILQYPDGRRELWALSRQVHTTGVACINLEDGGVAHRYCYESVLEAELALVEYSDPSNPPPGNWVKHKGWHNGRYADDLNPNWK